MKPFIYVPDSSRSAGRWVRFALAQHVERLSKEDFLRAWASMAYLFPGMHPDGITDSDNEWPRAIDRFVDEAWRRVNTGELLDAELYPSDAQWAGLCDRMHSLTDDERIWRQELTASYGDKADN